MEKIKLGESPNNELFEFLVIGGKRVHNSEFVYMGSVRGLEGRWGNRSDARMLVFKLKNEDGKCLLLPNAEAMKQWEEYTSRLNRNLKRLQRHFIIQDYEFVKAELHTSDKQSKAVTLLFADNFDAVNKKKSLLIYNPRDWHVVEEDRVDHGRSHGEYKFPNILEFSENKEFVQNMFEPLLIEYAIAYHFRFPASGVKDAHLFVQSAIAFEIEQKEAQQNTIQAALPKVPSPLTNLISEYLGEKISVRYMHWDLVGNREGERAGQAGYVPYVSDFEFIPKQIDFTDFKGKYIEGIAPLAHLVAMAIHCFVYSDDFSTKYMGSELQRTIGKNFKKAIDDDAYLKKILHSVKDRVEEIAGLSDASLALVPSNFSHTLSSSAFSSVSAPMDGDRRSLRLKEEKEPQPEVKSQAAVSSSVFISQNPLALDLFYRELEQPLSSLSISHREEIQRLIQQKDYAKVLLIASKLSQIDVLKILLNYKDSLNMNFAAKEIEEVLNAVLMSENPKEDLISLLLEAKSQPETSLPSVTVHVNANTSKAAEYKSVPTNYQVTSPLSPGMIYILSPSQNTLLEEFNQIEIPQTWDLSHQKNFKEKIQLFIMQRAYSRAIQTASHHHHLETVKVLLKHKDAIHMQFDDKIIADALEMDYFVPQAKEIAVLLKALIAAKPKASPSPSPQTEAEFKSQSTTVSSSLVANSVFSSQKPETFDSFLAELKIALSSLAIVDRDEMNNHIRLKKYVEVLLGACKKGQVDILKIVFKYKDNLNMNLTETNIEEAINLVLTTGNPREDILSLLFEEQSKLTNANTPH